jgi:serine/threonine-protein kinase RsbW
MDLGSSFLENIGAAMNHPHWNWLHEYRLPSDTSATPSVIEDLLAHLRDHCWNEHDLFGVHLALEEALVNAIKHGNAEDAGKQVQVHCRINGQIVQIEVADEGPGFNPAAVPDPTTADHLDMPHGRGIMLMRSFMSRVQYNEQGNRVLMEKQRSVQSNSAP